MKLYLALLIAILLQSCAPQPTRSGVGSEASQRERARIHTELGAGYYQQNQIAVALDEFTAAVSFDPTYSMAYNGLGMVYAALREDEKADASFKKAIALDPKDSEAHNNYGSFLCARNRIDESVVQFLGAVKNPLYITPGVAYMNAGLCTLRKPDVKAAEGYFRQALQLDPQLNQAAYQLAKIYYNDKKYQFARDALQNAVTNSPAAEVLWLGVLVERQLGDKNAEASYELELRRSYPDSEQTKALMQEK